MYNYFMTEKLIRIANDWGVVRREKTLSEIAQKIEAYLIWKVDIEDGDLPEVEININLLKRLGLKRHDLDAKIQDVAEELLTYVIHYIKPNGQWAKTTLCSSFEQVDDGYKVRMDKALKPFFLELKMYSQFSVNPLLSVGKSIYSHDLYKFLRTKLYAGKFKGWTRISIEELKWILGCSKSYSRWDNFQKSALRPAIKEICETTDISITYRAESGAKGKAKKNIFFEIKKQEYQGLLFDLNDNPVDYQIEPLPTEILNICHKLTFKPLGKSEELLRNALENNSAEVVLFALENIQHDWKEADDSTRGGIVHRVLNSYLRRSKAEISQKKELEQKLQDKEMAEAAFNAKKAKEDDLAKEYAQKHKRALYDKLPADMKQFYTFDHPHIINLLSGLALDELNKQKS